MAGVEWIFVVMDGLGSNVHFKLISAKTLVEKSGINMNIKIERGLPISFNFRIRFYLWNNFERLSTTHPLWLQQTEPKQLWLGTTNFLITSQSQQEENLIQQVSLLSSFRKKPSPSFVANTRLTAINQGNNYPPSIYSIHEQLLIN